MVKIKELPAYERPREKALINGVESLSDLELLTLIISNGTRNNSALEIAISLLSEYNGIINFNRLTLDDLIKIRGINKIKAIKLLSVIEFSKRSQKIKPLEIINDDLLISYFSNLYKNMNQEKAYIVLTNKKKELLFIKEIFSGSEDCLVFSSKIVLSYLIKYNANYFYLIHNHPSGNPNPSEDDISTTNSLELITLSINSYLIDHLIIGNQSYYSFKRKEIIPL
jgi:DNA repair protein RadC